MKHTSKQNSFSRAIQDTSAAQKTVGFMWVGQSVLGVGGGALLVLGAPADASIIEIVSLAVVGGLIGLLLAIAFVFVWSLFRAPYKQRNEALDIIYRLKAISWKEILKEEIYKDICSHSATSLAEIALRLGYVDKTEGVTISTYIIDAVSELQQEGRIETRRSDPQGLHAKLCTREFEAG